MDGETAVKVSDVRIRSVKQCQLDERDGSREGGKVRCRGAVCCLSVEVGALSHEGIGTGQVDSSGGDAGGEGNSGRQIATIYIHV